MSSAGLGYVCGPFGPFVAFQGLWELATPGPRKNMSSPKSPHERRFCSVRGTGACLKPLAPPRVPSVWTLKFVRSWFAADILLKEKKTQDRGYNADVYIAFSPSNFGRCIRVLKSLWRYTLTIKDFSYNISSIPTQSNAYN